MKQSTLLKVAFATLACLSGLAGAQTSIDWTTTEGTGFTFSTAEGLELQSTIVHAEAVEMSDGGMVLQMGFWGADDSPCAADFNRDGGVDGADVEAFFAAWESSAESSDVNQDGGIDGSDVQAFFETWERGC